jgi:RNA polymerase sigma factor (sigma-70 family)
VTAVPANDQDAQRVMEKLTSPESRQAWAEFLKIFSPLILHVVKLFESQSDHISDCFIFVCEKLREKNFRRLRRFRPNRGVRLSTWLWAVARNLCTDWHRREFGRYRISRSIVRLSDTDRAVFRCVYEQGFTREEAFYWLIARNPALTRDQVDGSCDRITSVLSSRRLWLLTTRNRALEWLEGSSGGRVESLDPQIPDDAPNPETAAALKEQEAALENALSHLSKHERLLITLRYEQGRTCPCEVPQSH